MMKISAQTGANSMYERYWPQRNHTRSMMTAAMNTMIHAIKLDMVVIVPISAGSMPTAFVRK